MTQLGRSSKHHSNVKALLGCTTYETSKPAKLFHEQLKSTAFNA